MIPGIDGIELCKFLRKNSSSIGIIILTAKSQEMDKISEQDEVRELSKNMELNIYNNKDNINENKYKEKKIQDLSELEEKNEQNFEYFPNYHFFKTTLLFN